MTARKRPAASSASYVKVDRHKERNRRGALKIQFDAQISEKNQEIESLQVKNDQAQARIKELIEMRDFLQEAKANKKLEIKRLSEMIVDKDTVNPTIG